MMIGIWTGSVFRIRKAMIRIRTQGSVQLDYGSGIAGYDTGLRIWEYGSRITEPEFFFSVAKKMPTKNNVFFSFYSSFFLLSYLQQVPVPYSLHQSSLIKSYLEFTILM
jgi:hypothetical protein